MVRPALEMPRFKTATVVALIALTGCAAPPRREPPAGSAPAGEGPSTSAPGPAPVAPGPQHPAGVAPAPTPAPVPPAEQSPGPAIVPADTPPELPDYLAVLERFHPGEPIRVKAEPAAPDRLVIETRNVSRLRIERNLLPLRSDRSIVLRLDGQAMEWLAGSSVSEFERSINGVWTAVSKRKE